LALYTCFVAKPSAKLIAYALVTRLYGAWFAFIVTVFVASAELLNVFASVLSLSPASYLPI